MEEKIKETNVEEKNVQNDPNYLQLIAAQNQSERMFKIRKIRNNINREEKKVVKNSILCGICFIGAATSMQLAGIDVEQAIQLEIDAITSYDALKTYFMEYMNPGILISVAGMVKTYISAVKHREKAQINKEDLEAMMETEPTEYMEDVDNKARTR